MIIALINNGIVENVIISDSLEFAESLGYDNIVDITNEDPQPSKRWTYDGQNFTSPENEVLINKPLTKWAFRKLFTIIERASIITKSKTDDIAETIIQDFNSVLEVDLSDADVEGSLDYLISVGVLIAKRKLQILAKENPNTFITNYSTNKLTLDNIIAENTKVEVFSDDTLPAGLSEDTDYYIINVSENECKLSTSQGGSAVSISDNGAGNHYIRINE